MRQKIFNRRWVEKEKYLGLFLPLLNQKSKLLQNYRQNPITPSKSRTVELEFLKFAVGHSTTTGACAQTSEKEFAAQLSQLLLAAQQQKELILESIET